MVQRYGVGEEKRREERGRDYHSEADRFAEY